MNETNLIDLMEREAESAPYAPAEADLERGKTRLRRRRVGTAATGVAVAASLVVAVGIATSSDSQGPGPDSDTSAAGRPHRDPAPKDTRAVQRRITNLTVEVLDPQKAHVGPGLMEGSTNADGQYEAASINGSWQDGKREGTLVVGMSSAEDTAHGPDTAEDRAYYRCALYFYTASTTCESKQLGDGSTVWVARDKLDRKTVLGVAYEQPSGGTAYVAIDRADRGGDGSPNGKPLTSLPVSVDDLTRLVQKPGLALPLPGRDRMRR
ncbi:hypothetical protein [Solicola gregarius]|uniref:Uncharacterized protein n=1 Tax=Solicola gregarius TaxID=2908642 RepID=A0AA46TLC8_9ACTN|nr:hypothetical protein [Solicola gregarius]UYM07434.1 hypothetical protein L0C25_10305 [Solicola gregarius]